jgi:hypothetical protein
MINISNEEKQRVLDDLATGRVDRRKFLAAIGATAAISMFGPSLDQALAANANQGERQASLQAHYDFIVVGAGAAGSVLAAELSASGAQVLAVESGGNDDARAALIILGHAAAAVERGSCGLGAAVRKSLGRQGGSEPPGYHPVPSSKRIGRHPSTRCADRIE